MIYPKLKILIAKVCNSPFLLYYKDRIDLYIYFRHFSQLIKIGILPTYYWGGGDLQKMSIRLPQV
jgi:hypothetical protein